MKSVHEGKRHDCSTCEQKFKTHQSLRKHIMAVHERRKPHLCSQCGFSCSHVANMKIHISVVHEGKKPYECNQCDKKYGYPYPVIQHILQYMRRRDHSYAQFVKKVF